MTIMGDTWNKWMENGKVILKEIGNKTEQTVELGKLQLQLTEKKQKRNKLFTSVGQLAFEIRKQEAAFTESEGVNTLCLQIEEASQEILRLEEMVAELKNAD